MPDLDALESIDWTARLAERKRAAEEEVGKLVRFVEHLEATLKAAREALSGIAAVVGVPVPPAPGAPAATPAAPTSAPAPRPAPAPGPVIPDALWARVLEIEGTGEGALLAPEVNALGMPAADGGNEHLVNELMVRGWELHPSDDGMVFNRVAAQQTLAARKAAIDNRAAARKG